MGLTEINSSLNVMQTKCSVCKENTIYVKFNGDENQSTPYLPDQFTCLECNQGFIKNNQNDD